VIFRSIDVLNILCAQSTHNLFAIAKFSLSLCYCCVAPSLTNHNYCFFYFLIVLNCTYIDCVHVHRRWAQFRQIITDIDNNVKELVADRAVKYCAHIGGGYYVSVNSGFYCVDVRKFYMPYNEKEVKPTRKGVALRLNEWARMKTIVETINSTYPSLGTAIPCYYQDDHNNQVGALECFECNPFYCGE